MQWCSLYKHSLNINGVEYTRTHLWFHDFKMLKEVIDYWSAVKPGNTAGQEPGF